MTSQEKQFDTARAEQFAGILVDTFNKASVTMMISLGHRTGLFDSMTGENFRTADEIAAKAELHPRYVREWLGAMVSSGIVEYDADNQTYNLPDEHAAFLTRQAGANNFAIFAQFIPALAKNEDDIFNCFNNGGGVTYDKYERFYHAMNEDVSTPETFTEHFLKMKPDLERRLKQGIKVLDAGCGTGALANLLASRFPQSSFLGMDFTEFAIEVAQKDAKSKGLSNVYYQIKDLSDFDDTAPEKEFDLILTIDAIHDQKNPRGLLKGIYKALKKDGHYVMVDINGTGHVHKDMENPFAPFLYSVSCMHCVPVSMGQGGEGLGAMWGIEKIRTFLNEAGFSEFELLNFESDPLNNWFVATK